MHLFVRISALIFLCSLGNGVQARIETQAPESISDVLETHLGRVVLLDFWASWCGPCRRSFPWMNGMLEKYIEQGLAVVSVNLDRNHADAVDFLQTYPANFAVVFDPDGNIARHFDVRTMPTSFLLDREGRVLTIHRGFLSKKTPNYEQSLIRALSIKDALASGFHHFNYDKDDP